ncbi:MAG TPA: hypothetical protein VFY81_01675, partial [Gammaproteobacteria bacterium]|nr:hypothetical protein [Gammaproteobacteria bacterium]
MPTEIRFPLTDSQPLCRALRAFGLVTFEALAEQVRAVPYGRPQKPDELLSVLTENRGTCSGKHRLLAAVAHECGRSEIELIVGIYAMSEDNTPGVGGVLQSAGVMSIPEAHCYLAAHGRRLDFTGLGSGS